MGGSGIEEVGSGGQDNSQPSSESSNSSESPAPDGSNAGNRPSLIIQLPIPSWPRNAATSGTANRARQVETNNPNLDVSIRGVGSGIVPFTVDEARDRLEQIQPQAVGPQPAQGAVVPTSPTTSEAGSFGSFVYSELPSDAEDGAAAETEAAAEGEVAAEDEAATENEAAAKDDEHHSEGSDFKEGHETGDVVGSA